MSKAKFKLTKGQYGKLSDLSMDIAKGLIVSAFVVPLFDHALPIFSSGFSVILGLIFVVFSLILEKLKGD